jgi:hypothetical protein
MMPAAIMTALFSTMMLLSCSSSCDGRSEINPAQLKRIPVKFPFRPVASQNPALSQQDLCDGFAHPKLLSR